MYVPCLNRLCDGVAETLGIVHCENSPNCEIERHRVPRRVRSTRTTGVYCPSCMTITKEERLKKLKRETYMRNKSKRAKEQQAESSSMGENRGAFSGVVLPDSNHFSSTSGMTTESSEDIHPPSSSSPQTSIDPLGTWTPISPQFPVDPLASSSPQTSIDLHSDPQGTWAPISPELPVHPPMWPHTPINPELLYINSIFSNGVDPIESMRDAEQLLRSTGAWPASPDPENPK